MTHGQLMQMVMLIVKVMKIDGQLLKMVMREIVILILMMSHPHLKIKVQFYTILFNYQRDLKMLFFFLYYTFFQIDLGAWRNGNSNGGEREWDGGQADATAYEIHYFF